MSREVELNAKVKITVSKVHCSECGKELWFAVSGDGEAMEIIVEPCKCVL